MTRLLKLLVLLVSSAALRADAALAADRDLPTETWRQTAPADVGLDAALLDRAANYAQTGDGSGYITRHGRLVRAWGDAKQTFDLKSTTKSIGVTALGLAIADGKVTLETKATSLHPTFGTPPESNTETGWLGEITLQHLATQTAGFEKPGGYGKLLFEPGTKWHYSDAGPNWLAECLTLAYRQDMDSLLFERVFTPIGITREDLRWRKNQYRDREIDGLTRCEFGAGIHANVDAMARIGLLYLNEGRWGDEQLIPAEFVRLARGTFEDVVGLPEQDDNHGNASDHYGLLWWNNTDAALENIPRDAYWSWGLYDSLIVVIPSLDIVISRAGKSWQRNDGDGHYEVLRPFLEPIVQAAGPAATGAGLSSEASGGRVRSEADGPAKADDTRAHEITGIDWAPPDTVIRKARGSDNWPMTWADDDALYTAYGDGWGFEPRVEKKLSLGLARITGGPDDFVGENLRSATAEQIGDGARGKKASGLLCVDGVLYMLVRNAGNSQLAWSEDHGKSWAWADWKFTTSFGCPTFVNYGRDYAGSLHSAPRWKNWSPEEFVYVISFDSDSAYEAADRLVLARVPKDRITEREAYQFFHEIDPFAGPGSNAPTWSRDVEQRGAILERPGKCYRCGVTYNAPLNTYLLAMLPGGDTREAGGLAVYAAPKAWGPWRAIFETDNWDIGPGESASFPTKWMSDDGRTVHLVFSGNDSFSVRKGTLRLKDE
jgi:CubicO group peptidase (beta-lactamase class C family)